MEISVIASGSNGNSCLVEDKGTSVLIDAGKSGKEIEARMNRLGKALDNIHGVVLSHSHHDHIASAGVISRRYDVPVYMTKESFDEAGHKLGRCEIKAFHKSRPFRISSMSINPIPTSHNVDSCGFVIGKFGLFTDTGTVTKEMEHIIPKLKGVLLESNHDIDMVVHGPYPPHLKQWILSDIGHLSNIHASLFLQEKGENLSLALLGHLSGNNNTPELCRTTFETLVKRKIDYHICSRDSASGNFVI